jgi:hypothetical protein
VAQLESFTSADDGVKALAEFLVRDYFPWSLVREIGVINEAVRREAEEKTGGTVPVMTRPAWYY